MLTVTLTQTKLLREGAAPQAWQSWAPGLQEVGTGGRSDSPLIQEAGSLGHVRGDEGEINWIFPEILQL